jgi:hypothetical protein
MLQDEYQPYWQAGCRSTVFSKRLNYVELGRVAIDDREGWADMVSKCDEHSVIIVEGLWRDWERWHKLEADDNTGVTFDLYYCGIVFFDKNRFKQNYIINF